MLVFMTQIISLKVKVTLTLRNDFSPGPRTQLGVVNLLALYTFKCPK